MEIRERFAWEGRSIAWGRAGSGPDVVFCHGTPWSSRTWSAYADALSRDFTVHLWDMPGYGRSSKLARHAVDLVTQGRAFAALLRHWGLRRPHVVAHDIGGAVSLRANLFEQAAFGSLLLLDVVAIPPAGSPFFRYVQEYPALLGELPGYVHEAVVREYVRGASARGLREDDLAELVAPWTTAAGQAAFYRQIAAFDEEPLTEIEAGLAELEMPVTVVWGADDTWIPLRTGRRLARLVPGAGLTEIPGAGHLVQYDAPVALADRLRTWLAAQSA